MRRVLTGSKRQPVSAKAFRLLSLTLATACGSSDGTIVGSRGGPPVVTPAPAISLGISPTTLTLSQGASGLLVVSINGGSPTAPPTLVACASASPSILAASVDGTSCRVSGFSPGSTTVTATVSTGQAISANVTVTVALPALTNFTVTPAVSSLTSGQIVELTLLPTTGGASVEVAYTFSSSNTTVATVTSTGVVTAVGVGTATITVTATGSGTGFATTSRPVAVSVTVSSPVSLSIIPTVLTVPQGASGLLTVSITGGNPMAPPTLAACTSASVAIATSTVEGTNCRVTGVTSGSTAVTATLATGQAITASVTVSPRLPALTGFVVTPSSTTLRVGQSVTLLPVPSTAGAGVSVVYLAPSNSNPSVVNLTSNFVVTGATPGTAVIALSAWGSGGGFASTTLLATVTVTVTPATTLGVGFGIEQFSSVPSGSYLRGSTNGPTNEQPVRDITISAFRMQRTEVTQGQWRQVMTGTALANPSRFSPCGDSCPVEQVSWDEVEQFLSRLNQQDPGKGYRLPTESEWEYAARAGTTTDYNVPGQAVEALGWLTTNSQGRTWPVAQKLSNAFGLFDTHGNVYEWVQDWSGPDTYMASVAVNPQGPATGTARMVRGGSWFDVAFNLRSAARFASPPSTRFSSVGFRVARNP